MTHPGAQSTQPVTRRYLLDALGEAMVTPLVARDGVDVAVTDLVIHDSSAAPVIEPGDVVLAVGLSLDDRDGTALLQRAGEAGATAVAFRSATHSSILRSLLDGRGPMETHARHLNVSTAMPHSVVGFSVRPDDEGSADSTN